MSHAQVTLHRTTTTTTTTAVLINVGYAKTAPGILKILHILLGIACTAIIGHYIKWYNSYSTYGSMVPELFFLLISTACLITSTVLLFSSLCSISTSAILPKTLFESMYHVVATVLYLAAGLTLLIYLNKDENKGRIYDYEPKVAAAAMGLTNAGLYLIASLYSVKSYRRG